MVSEKESMETCVFHENLFGSIEHIKKKVDQINEKMGEGNVVFENLKVRMNHVEKVVYGALGFSCLTVLGLVLNLVFGK